MRLKEKLAKEHAGWDQYTKDLKYSSSQLRDELREKERNFLAGFEKAREMAQHRFLNKAMVRPKHKDEPRTINMVVVNGERFEFTMMEDFQNLGEEEVNDLKDRKPMTD